MGLALYFRIIAIMSYSKKSKDTHYTHSNITFCWYKKDEKAWKILFQVKKKNYIKKGGWHAKQINGDFTVIFKNIFATFHWDKTIRVVLFLVISVRLPKIYLFLMHCKLFPSFYITRIQHTEQLQKSFRLLHLHLRI